MSLPKMAFFLKRSAPRLVHGSLGHTCPHRKRHLDRFSRFTTALGRVEQTNTHLRNTDNNRPHLMLCIAMRPNNNFSVSVRIGSCVAGQLCSRKAVLREAIYCIKCIKAADLLNANRRTACEPTDSSIRSYVLMQCMLLSISFRGA